MLIGAIVVGALVVLLVLFAVVGFNKLRTSDIGAQEALGGIDVQLTRRAELIPNLVETVKGYAAHEKSVFEEVTAARTGLKQAAASGDVAQKAAADAAMQQALVKATGFREYDARWLFGSEINLAGIQDLGLCLGTLLHRRGVRPHIVVGHDYRAYSSAIKYAMTSGLIAAGCHVHDIGLCTTPMAYFAQFALDVPAVAMVTASHNENGWTGVKMGANRPLTFGPDEMTRLKEIVLNSEFKNKVGGSYQFHENFPARYIADLTNRPKLKRKLKVVVACGNGTAGAFAPQVMEKIGCEVIPLDTKLDHTFPKYNPNPEDMEMLHAIRDAVLEHKADVGLGFDGDGDRCGVVDNTGEEIFADKVGVMLARDMSAIHKDAQFVVDVKSTGLFVTDPVLQKQGAKATYWKTGHSYMKRRTHEVGALAGFEKSGHFFFNKPFGRGYDDGLVSAIAVCDI